VHAPLPAAGSPALSSGVAVLFTWLHGLLPVTTDTKDTRHLLFELVTGIKGLNVMYVDYDYYYLPQNLKLIKVLS